MDDTKQPEQQVKWKCPHCQAEIPQVPSPKFMIPCPSCGKELYLPKPATKSLWKQRRDGERTER